MAPTDAVCLLGGVDEQKEERERARGDRALLHAQSVDFAKQVVERRSAGLTVTPSARRRPKALDDLEGFHSFQSLDDAAEGAGQPANVVVEREILLAGGHGHSCYNYARSDSKLIWRALPNVAARSCCVLLESTRQRCQVIRSLSNRPGAREYCVIQRRYRRLAIRIANSESLAQLVAKRACGTVEFFPVGTPGPQ